MRLDLEYNTDLFDRARMERMAGHLDNLLAALIAGLFPVTILGELVSIGTLLAFTTVCIGVLVLRYTRPDLKRPFRTPVPWITCTAGALPGTASESTGMMAPPMPMPVPRIPVNEP